MANTLELIATTTAAVDVTGVGFDLIDLKTFSIGVTFTGGAGNLIGTLKLQASLDNNANAAGSTWVDVANSTQAVASSANHIWDVTVAGYRWVRVVWTYTSGTGNIYSSIFVKQNVVQYA